MRRLLRLFNRKKENQKYGCAFCDAEPNTLAEAQEHWNTHLTITEIKK